MFSFSPSLLCFSRSLVHVYEADACCMWSPAGRGRTPSRIPQRDPDYLPRLQSKAMSVLAPVDSWENDPELLGLKWDIRDVQLRGSASAPGNLHAPRTSARAHLGLGAIDRLIGKLPTTSPDTIVEPERLVREAGWASKRALEVRARMANMKKWKTWGSRISMRVALNNYVIENRDGKKVEVPAVVDPYQVPKHFGAIQGPVVKDRRHHIRNGAELWHRAAKRVANARSFIRPATPLTRLATKVYTDKDGPPKPIRSSTAAFDKLHRSQVRRSRLALKLLAAHPSSEEAYCAFSYHLGELNRVRHVLNAPVDSSAALYPDGVWGIAPQELNDLAGERWLSEGVRPATREGIVKPSTPHEVVARHRGIQFIESRNTHRGDKIRSLRPTLPTVRARTSPEEHKLLPDSHFALGAFLKEGFGPGYRDKNVKWKAYKTPGAATALEAEEQERRIVEERKAAAEAKKRAEELAATATPPDDWAPGGALNGMLFGGPSDDDVMKALMGEGSSSDDEEDDWLSMVAIPTQNSTQPRNSTTQSTSPTQPRTDCMTNNASSAGDRGEGDHGAATRGDSTAGSSQVRGDSADGSLQVEAHTEDSGKAGLGAKSVLSALQDGNDDWQRSAARSGIVPGVGKHKPFNFWSSVASGTAGCPELAWLDGSIWRARKFGPRPADSRDFVDHKECMRAAFKEDWERTSGQWFIRQIEDHVDPSACCRPFGLKSLPVEVIRKMEIVVEKYYPMLLRIFAYYSCVGADVTNEVNGIGLGGYMQLVNDAKLDINASGPKATHAKPIGEDGWDLLWVTINESKISLSQEYNNRKRFTRTELLEWVVRGAIDKKPIDEMVDKVGEFCEDLRRFMSQDASIFFDLHTSEDEFRMEYCYLRPVEAMLRHHEETLRSVFKVYAEIGSGGIDTTSSTDLMTATEWINLMRDIGILKECGHRPLFLAFAQSRMTCIDESSRQSVQLTQLPFEGFLEAIIRVSLLKALPTDKEMAKKGFFYPNEYLGAIIEGGLPMYEAWVIFSKRAQAAGKGDPIYRRIDMFLLLIIGVMQYGIEQQKGGPSLLLRGSPDEILTVEEVTRYIRKPMRNVFGGGGTGGGAGGGAGGGTGKGTGKGTGGGAGSPSKGTQA